MEMRALVGNKIIPGEREASLLCSLSPSLPGASSDPSKTIARKTGPKVE